jgi:hypothetical protein
VLLDDIDERHLIAEIAGNQLNLLLNMGDAFKIHCARSANHAYDFVTFFQ